MEILGNLMQKFLLDPNWLTVFLLFGTLFFTMFLTWIGRKKMRLSPYQRNDGVICIRAINTSSNRNIQVDRYGFIDKSGNKRIFDKTGSLLNQQILPGAIELLPIPQYPGEVPLAIGEMGKLFVQDTSGKIY